MASLFVKLFKSLAPGRAAGGFFYLISYFNFTQPFREPTVVHGSLLFAPLCGTFNDVQLRHNPSSFSANTIEQTHRLTQVPL